MKKRILSVIFALCAALVSFALAACNGGGNQGGENMQSEIIITVGGRRLNTSLVENAATAALKERLKTAPVTVGMSDYGCWEKVGDFGFSLPTSNEQVTTEPCDFVLYQGNQLVIFYGSNSWSYTRLGRIEGVSRDELMQILGDGDVTVTLSLAD